MTTTGKRRIGQQHARSGFLDLRLAGTVAIVFCMLSNTGHCVPLECDAAIVGEVVTPEEVDCFTFVVTAEERISVCVKEEPDSDLDGILRLLDAGGTVLIDWDRGCQDSPLLGVAGSPYRVEVAANRLESTGSYSIHLQRLTSGVSCDETTLPCNTTLEGQEIEHVIDSDLFSFEVTPDEIVRICVREELNSSLDEIFRLLRADGTTVMDWGRGCRDSPPLPATGSPYRVQVTANRLESTGGYSIDLQRLTSGASCNETNLPCGTTIEGQNIEHVIDSDLFSFEATPDEIVRICVREEPGSSLDDIFRLLRADGTVVMDWDRGCKDSPPLSAAGNPYRVQVAANRLESTGSYSIHLQRLTSGASCNETNLPCDTTLEGQNIEHVIDSDLFSFEATPDEIVRICVREEPGSSLDDIFRLLRADGTIVMDWDRGCKDSPPLSAAGNPYRIQVAANRLESTGGYNVTLECQSRATQDFVRGDANNDGNVDISDAVKVFGVLFRGLPISCEKAGDADDNGTLQITDGVVILRYLFPFSDGRRPGLVTDCGEDPKPDALTCEDYSFCDE